MVLGQAEESSPEWRQLQVPKVLPASYWIVRMTEEPGAHTPNTVQPEAEAGTVEREQEERLLIGRTNLVGQGIVAKWGAHTRTAVGPS